MTEEAELILQRYLDLANEHGELIRAGKVKAANRLAEKWRDYAKAVANLVTTEAELRALLGRLAEANQAAVSSVAARFLGSMPAIAEPVLLDLCDHGHRPDTRLEAMGLLSEWRKGRLKLDWQRATAREEGTPSKRANATRQRNITLDKLLTKARKLGFSNLDAIRRLARTAVDFRPNKMPGKAPPGISRMGGAPALPSSVSWPRRDGRSLAFVGQMNLGAMPCAMVEQGIPASGLLLFFYDDEQPCGSDPADAGACAVVHAPDAGESTPLSAWPDDVPEDSRYKACGLKCLETITLPDWGCLLVEELNLDEDELTAYQDLLAVASDEGDAGLDRGLLGGHPDQLQADMMLLCALVAAGLDDSEENSRLPAIRQQAHDWRLLLQVPTISGTGMEWGSGGCIYFWIREDDLRERRFDRCWTILQCT